MAPHQGTSPPAWTDELASVFELAEALFEAGDSHTDNHRRHKVVGDAIALMMVNRSLAPL